MSMASTWRTNSKLVPQSVMLPNATRLAKTAIDAIIAIFARRVISMGVSGGTPATRMKDDARYFANSRIASSASTPPVIEIGA